MPQNHFSEIFEIHGIDNNSDDDLDDDDFDDGDDECITPIVRY